MIQMVTTRRITERLRWASQHYVFGAELERAKTTHWETQWLPEAEVSAIQWSNVSAIVRHAWTASPFYRVRLGDDFFDRPLTRANFDQIAPLRRSEVTSHAKGIRCHTGMPSIGRRSGGSGGRAVQIPVDSLTYSWYLATLWRGLQWWGVDVTNRGALLLGLGTRGISRIPGRLKDWIMNWLRIPVDGKFDLDVLTLPDRLMAFGPEFLYGYPSAVDRLAELVRNQGWHGPPVRVVVLTGEPIYQFQQRRIEEAFQCPVVQEYGSGELGCLAFQCPHGTLHITAENVFLETVGLKSIVGPGGTILVTHLRNYTFPLIRYQTGDVGVLPATSCSCGRGLPALELIGRHEHYLAGSNGSKPASTILDQFISGIAPGLQGRVRLVQKTPDSLVIQAEQGRAQPAELREAKARLETLLGPEWHVGVASVERLDRLPSGKMPYLKRSMNVL